MRGQVEASRRIGRRIIASGLLCLLAATVRAATIADRTESPRPTQWVDEFVTPLKNVSLSQILGRWYEVEQVRSFPLQPDNLCETLDFYLSSDNSTVLLNHSLSSGSESFDLPTMTVLPDASWMNNRYQDGYKVLDISADGGLLSLASCSMFARACYGVILARDFNVTGRHADLLEAHRGMSRAGLNDTGVGHRQQPDACLQGLHQRRLVLSPVQYDVSLSAGRNDNNDSN